METKAVLAVLSTTKGQKPIYRRVGTAFPNEDGTISVSLDALPTNGRLYICDPLPRPSNDAAEESA